MYRQLRDDAPCYHDDDLGFWALSRYDDVVRALHDPDTFCSRFGITLEAGNSLPMMLTTDPPEHTALRRLVSRAFTPRRVADLEPAIRALSTDYLDRLREQRAPDLIVDYAAPLPMDVISRLLGVPDGDQEQLRGLERRAVAPRRGRHGRHPGRDRRRVPALQVLLRVRGRTRAPIRAPTISRRRWSRPRARASISPTTRSSASCSC